MIYSSRRTIKKIAEFWLNAIKTAFEPIIQQNKNVRRIK